MASLFQRYKSTPFTPQISDDQWDAIKAGIEANKKDIDAELVSIALSFLATQPGFANLVAPLASFYKVVPSVDVKHITETVSGAVSSLRG